MIPRECKRLAGRLPIAEVSKHAAREKSIRHGHRSTLRLWWARRPLLMAFLLTVDAHWRVGKTKDTAEREEHEKADTHIRRAGCSVPSHLWRCVEDH